MEVLKTTKKSWHLDTLEKYYIYIYTQPKWSSTKWGVHGTNNPIFNTTYQYYHPSYTKWAPNKADSTAVSLQQAGPQINHIVTYMWVQQH
jgi:hypothetical protein